jgi:hypothetical protein
MRDFLLNMSMKAHYFSRLGEQEAPFGQGEFPKDCQQHLAGRRELGLTAQKEHHYHLFPK